MIAATVSRRRVLAALSGAEDWRVIAKRTLRRMPAIGAGRWISLRAIRSIGARLLAFLPFARGAAFGAARLAFAGIQRPLQLGDGGRAGELLGVFEPAERFDACLRIEQGG
ncbi:MAG TPA: hypothetical protein VNH11_35410 [Pirellulales bacterium]|nr:hypothetical protein [Pirellulales bacterium]